MENKNLKKSLYQAFKKALGSKSDQDHATRHIVEDILDSNMVAEVPSNHIPAPKQNILHKDISPSEIHQQKQAQAEAKLGMPPKMPGMKKVGYGGLMVNEEQGMEAPQKGVGKLKKFMEKCEMKKAQKGVHSPDYSTQYIKDGKTQHGISTAGIKTREAQNPSSFEEYSESPKRARAIHKQKLQELKEMPKPKLPK